jgi:hypothetical protein
VSLCRRPLAIVQNCWADEIYQDDCRAVALLSALVPRMWHEFAPLCRGGAPIPVLKNRKLRRFHRQGRRARGTPKFCFSK